MNRKLQLSLATSFALLGGCTSQVSVDTQFDSDVNFSAYKTYQWRAPNKHNEATSAYLANDIVDKRIRNSIDSQLLAKGFVKTEKADADFLVNCSVASKDRTDVKTYNTYSGFAPGWGFGGHIGAGPYRYGGVGVSFGTLVSSTEQVNYQQGTLVVDILTPDSDTLVWRGTGEGRIPKSMDQQTRNELIDEAVEKILMNFPPKTK